MVIQGVAGYLRYHDTSTGNLLTEIRTKLGPCEVMTQNPHNAILHLGHSNGSLPFFLYFELVSDKQDMCFFFFLSGTVTYWSPNMQTPLVKMLCHTGPVKAVAVDNGGK